MVMKPTRGYAVEKRREIVALQEAEIYEMLKAGVWMC